MELTVGMEQPRKSAGRTTAQLIVEADVESNKLRALARTSEGWSVKTGNGSLVGAKDGVVSVGGKWR